MTQEAKPVADRVIVAVFDGLRPDMVTPELTPNMMRLAARGTWFREARSVFPSVTRVATTSIASGAPPTVHGIIGNAFYHPAAFPDRVFDTGRIEHIRRAEAAHEGRFVDAETLGDVLAGAGRRLAVVHTGSGGSAHMISPRARANGHWTFSVHGPDATQTPEAVAEAVQRIGPLPERELPRLPDARYAGQVMTDHVLPILRPDVALVWFNEPDTSFHYREIGSDDSKRALAEADAAFGRILDWVENEPDAERIAVIAASDHGQIATSAADPLFADAGSAGFAIGERDALADAAFVATGGRSGEIRLLGGDRAALSRLAAWLMEHPAVGHVFARGRNEVDGELPGTLSLDLVGQGHARQADLMFVLKSDVADDRYGLPGRGLMTPGDVPVGGGMHGGLNPHELNTVLIVGAETAEGRGMRSSAPAGIIDIAPTVLGLLGLPPAPTMVGRNLALPPRAEPKVTRFSAESGAFLQHVDMVEQDGRRFIVGGH
ncbi:alkaline phosphatase family protein [Chelatococcus sp. GCM10030263]|uniref:alkaline phosphatase family protein n=1 Tax=Chelatococcus sp. GCM10030263 TaxID=3273387 RepID=UPI0036218716